MKKPEINTKTAGFFGFSIGVVACAMVLIPVAYFDSSAKAKQIASLQSEIDQNHKELEDKQLLVESTQSNLARALNAPPPTVIQNVKVEVNSPRFCVPDKTRFAYAIVQLGYQEASNDKIVAATSATSGSAWLQVFTRKLTDWELKVGQIYQKENGEIGGITMVGTVKSKRFDDAKIREEVYSEIKKLADLLIGNVPSIETLLTNPSGKLEQRLYDRWIISVTKKDSAGVAENSNLVELIVVQDR